MRRSQFAAFAASMGLLASGVSTAQDPVPADPQPVVATEAVPATGRWTLEALQEIALQNNPTMRQAAASVDMARGLHRQVGLYPNLQLGYLRTDGDISGKSRSVGAFFGQEVVTAGKLEEAQAAESWEIEQGNFNYQAQISRVRNDIALRFFEVLAAQRAYKLADRLEVVALRGLETTQKALELKEAPKPDLTASRCAFLDPKHLRVQSNASAPTLAKPGIHGKTLVSSTALFRVIHRDFGAILQCHRGTLVQGINRLGLTEALAKLIHLAELPA